MTRALSNSADPQPTPRAGQNSPRSPFLPVLMWLSLQLLTLGLIVTRTPFSATKKFPQPSEVIAFQVMLVVQIAASAMLFPFLLRDVRTTVMVMVGSWPFTVLAGFLTGVVNVNNLPAATVFVTAWMVGLAIWRATLRSPRAMGAGIAVAMLLALGGPLLWYLQAEYVAQSDAVVWPAVAAWGPMMGALALVVFDPRIRAGWGFVGGHVGFALVVRALQWGILRRAR